MADATTSSGQTCKLLIHQKQYSELELVISLKEFPDLKVDDVVEIYHPEDQFNRLLLQVKQFSDEPLQANSISIDTYIAQTFKLRGYKDVIVNHINPKTVALDLAELTYKEHYFSKADMWRLRQSLVKSCIYLTKKIHFAEMRAQVNELWAKGEQVTCGVVTEDTRVTFRSSTAQVNIFLQMSSEMWEFDNYGDLYFEKAIGGFLVELFNKWKDKNCNHDVTITLFSRTFYDASAIEDFPMHMRECVQRDNQGRFYEDFYRVVVQNERYDDWTPTIVQLKKLFLEYRDGVLRYHEKDGVTPPQAWNSASAQGNFLEVLNMALNAFEKHYLDRSFDRTGKLSIVITPGTGVFEVDRELMNITKQRTIDCGNGSDLVCMGEQPLHAVPLFKFHSKNPQTSKFTSDVGDDYNIPHWINHSFYTSHCQSDWIRTSKFLPRIKVPMEQEEVYKSCKRSPIKQRLSDSQTGILSCIQGDMNLPFVDYDDYDSQVFKLPNQQVLKQSMSTNHRSATRRSRSSGGGRWPMSSQRIPRVRCNSDITRLIPEEKSSRPPSKTILIPQASTSSESNNYMSNSYGGCSEASTATDEDVFYLRPVVGSAGSPVGYQGPSQPHSHPTAHRRALINPFAPSRLHFKVTSNRRRWAHAFPIDPRGASIQPHHIHSASELAALTPSRDSLQGQSLYSPRIHQISESSDDTALKVHGHRKKTITISSNESGSEDSSSIKEPAVLVAPANVMSMKPHAASPVNLPKVDSTSSLCSIYNMYDLNTGSAGSTGRMRSLTVGIPGGGGRVSTGTEVPYQSSLPRGIEEGHNWLWGTTGEQEWTPETTTGMDWKSMTMPASLPITTDYFPDRRSLQMDYLMSDYALLPDDVNSDWHTASQSVRKPLSTAQVYRELVAQRLAQGFQLVICPKQRAQRTTAEMVTLGTSPYQPSAFQQPAYQQPGYQQPGYQQSGFQQAGYQQAGPMMTSGLLRALSRIETVEEHILSIGRIFHKLSMNGNNIKVQRYWPRHPYPQKSIHYTYRFQVPDSGSYDVSWTNFSYEKLENYNWNYVDLYILTRGAEEDYSLMESLKYWRSRFCLLPSNNPATRKIIDGSIRCDIYEDTPVPEQSHLIDGFLRFIEIMNKIKRPAQSRKPKMSLSRCHSVNITPSCLTTCTTSEKEKNTLSKIPRCQTMSDAQKPVLKFRKDRKQMAVRRHSLTQSPFGTLVVGGEKGETLVTKVKTKVNEVVDSLPVSGGTSGQMDLKKSSLMQGGADSTPSGSSIMSPSGFYIPDNAPLDRTLTVHSSLKDIKEAMLDNAEGLSFLIHHPSLPSLPTKTFIAAEAVTWVRNNIAGVSDLSEALSLLQTMVDDQVICHASGNSEHRFIYGFFLYNIIVDADKTKDAGMMLQRSKYYYNTSFQYEWCEVAVHIPPQPTPTPTLAGFRSALPTDSAQSQYLRNTSPLSQQSEHTPGGQHDWGGRSTQSATSGGTMDYNKTMGTPQLMLDLAKLSNSGASPMYKVVNADVDPTLKSDRQEWGTARYHGNYSPCCAFELEVQWLVATGCIMGELVQCWSRKASSYGFHFLPIPGDPFALPFNANSDPLRGPIFVPLSVDCLRDPAHGIIMDDDNGSSWEETLLIFQEAMLKRFGFMPDRCLPSRTSFAFGDEGPPQYVHCTGGMFVLIPDIKATSPRNRDGTHRKPNVATYLDYIIHQRQRSDSVNLGQDVSFGIADPLTHNVDSPPTVHEPTQGGGTHCSPGENRVGFLWAWNYMLNRKWRTSSTGDEHFQDKMLADFRAFCLNVDNRLVDFWLSCQHVLPSERVPVTCSTQAGAAGNGAFVTNESIQANSSVLKCENGYDASKDLLDDEEVVS